MKSNHAKQRLAILRALRDARRPIGSDYLAREIQAFGFEISARTIRLYLQEMEGEGLVSPARRGRRGGRTVTPRGLAEIKDASVAERVGFTAAKVDALTWKMTFEHRSAQGKIVVNVSTVDADQILPAIRRMRPVFDAGLSMGRYLVLASAGQWIGDFQVPVGKVGIGTVCSVTLNGVLLGARVPMVSRFGGVLEIEEGKPVRFTDVIHYDGTTLDPLEIFIKSGLTNVTGALEGHGRIGASFREFPTAAMGEVLQLLRRMETLGLDGVVMVGKPDRPLLDFPVPSGSTGMIVTGGLNPVACLEESGVPTSSHAMSTLYDFLRLVHYRDAEEYVRKNFPSTETARTRVLPPVV